MTLTPARFDSVREAIAAPHDASPPMRILMLSHTNAPWTAHYARYFQRRGDVICVGSFAPHPIPGVDVRFLGREPFDKYKNKHLFFTRLPMVKRLIREFRPDLLFAAYLSSNGLTGVLTWGGPLVVSARGGDVLEQAGRRGWRRWLRERVIRFVCRRCEFIHTVSAELDETLIRLGVPARKLHRFPIGVDVELFRPATDAPRPVIHRIICTRQHEPIYDNATIVDALARVRAAGRDFRCTFVGGGHLQEKLIEKARTLGLADRVVCSGHLPHERLPDLLRDADLYVSASLSDGTSSSLLEAMASGLFPITTRIRANQEWIEPGRNGLLFAPGSADELAAALMRAMDDSRLRREAVEENRARIERDGNSARNMRRMADLFQQAVAAGKRG